MAKYTYSIETFYSQSWMKLFSESRDFCLGYLSRVKDFSPRNAYRLVRSDGKIIESVPENLEVQIGQIAGWPTSGQYKRAADNALKIAAEIEKRENKNLKK